ncbi:MAG: mechanosensitive ion channel family protein [Selenomonadaceae bacterium]|nr:mechanosensitive ion channel family protein [Selenomonadaceae bacterium]
MLNRRIEQHLKNEESSIKTIFFNALKGVPISFCFVVGLYWVVSTSALPAGMVTFFSYILFTSIIFSMARVVERTLSGFIGLKFSGSSDASQSTLLDTILKVAVYASGLLIVLNYYGISIAPIITAMGVGGMAIAFGIKETMENIFAGLQILISKQIRVGDYIKLSTGDEGKVTDINWRFITVMPAHAGNVVVIPNKVIAESTSTNYSKPNDEIFVVVPVGVGYESDLEKVEQVTLEVAREMMIKVDGYEPNFDSEGVDRNPLAPYLRYNAFGDSSINFNIFMRVTNFKNQALLKHEFIKKLKRRFSAEGINIPYPTRTLVSYEEDLNIG